MLPGAVEHDVRAGEPLPPSSQDPVAAGLAEAIGGPPGRHATTAGRRFWTPVRWLVLLTLVTSLFGWWQKSPCRIHPWEDGYQYTRVCYTDVFALYFAERLDDGAVPYLDHPVEYPVVIGGVMQLAASAVDVFPSEERPRRFYDVTWALLTACALVVVVTTARLAGRRRVWDAALVAVAPALVLHGTTNWDLVAMALAGLGLVAWARERPLAAGALLGLATATKLYPLLFLLPLLLLCLRAGRLRAFATTAVAAVLVPFAVAGPVYLASPSFGEVGGEQVRVADSPLQRFGEEGLAALSPHVTVPGTTPEVVGVNAAYRFVELNASRPADWDSLWYALQVARGGTPLDSGSPPTLLNTLTAVCLVVALAGIVVLALRAPRRPRLPQLLLLVVVAFLVTSKVWSPQFSLWLVPLVALALPRWRPFLAWQAAEAVLLPVRYLFFVGLATPGEGLSAGWLVGAVLLRDAVLLGLCALVVRDVLRPDHDVVRAEGADDPAGGVLDGAPDQRRSYATASA